MADLNTARRIRLRLLRVSLSVLALAGCPDDDGPPGGGRGTEGTGTSGTGTTALDTSPPPDTGTDELEVPEEFCVDPPLPPAPLPVPSFEETDNAETLLLDQATDPCPDTFSAFFDAVENPQPVPQVLQLEIHRPALGTGEWPPGQFNFIAFTHGNGQNGTNYDELLGDLAQSGFVTASVINDGNSSGRGRASRVLCVAEALLDGNVAWSGAGQLNGRYAITGHSTGGLGAFIAVSTVLDDPGLLAGHELVSVATLAPNPITADLGLMLGPNAPPYFVMQGTGDGDTSGAAPSHYDSVVPQTSGVEVGSASRKVMVWSYDVEHSEYGGKGPAATCPTTAKGVALGTTYFNGFLVGTFHEDPDALGLFFATGSPTPLIPPEVADPVLWPGFGGEPQVFGTSSQRVNAEQGFAARIIDGFENSDPMVSDAGLAVSPSAPGMYQESDVAALFDTQHLANAAIVGWDPGNEILWEMDFDMRVALAGATSLTFRVGAAVDVADEVACSGVAGSLPSMTLIVSDGENVPVEIDLAPYGRLTLPETREELSCASLGETDGCHAWDVMQTTFRVPVGVMCDPADGVFLSRIEEVGLRFDGPGIPPRLLLLDDLEIRSVPGEPGVDPSCRCPPTPG